MLFFKRNKKSKREDSLPEDSEKTLADSCKRKEGAGGSGCSTSPATDSNNIKNIDDSKLAEFIYNSPIPIIKVSEEGEILEKNEAFCKLANCECAMRCNRCPSIFSIFMKDDLEDFKKRLNRAIEGVCDKTSGSYELKSMTGKEVSVSAYFSPSCSESQYSDDNNKEVYIHLIDRSEQKSLELRFAHSQKMQAVGQLAGGIAHDFNNLLTAMIGFCDLLLMRHPTGDPSFADIMQIKQNANRAANLVRQLLAFSRRQTLQPKILDMTELLAELSNLIRRLIGDNVELNMKHGRDIYMVKADQGQLEQVIINLAVNARDAMVGGGTLTIESQNVVIDSNNQVPRGYIAPVDEKNIENGEYVLIEISDTGCGMSEELISKIFEPFFSTKEVGEGTGLGLATVYGIVKQTGGYLYVKSKENVGTSFQLYFPRYNPDENEDDDSDAIDADKNKEITNVRDLTGVADILIVEDEAPVRIFAARALRNKGYNVMEADSGEKAIEVFEDYIAEDANNRFDVIISDVMMPGINGPDMIRELEKRYPDKLKKTDIIFISGYAEDAFIDDCHSSQRNFNFLPKPFSLKQLASKIKEVTS